MKEYPVYKARFRAVTCFALQNFSQQKKALQYSNLGNNPFNFFQFIVNYIDTHFPNCKLNPLNDVCNSALYLDIRGNFRTQSCLLYEEVGSPSQAVKRE